MRAVKLINALDGNSFKSKVNETLCSIIKNTIYNHIVKLDIYVNCSDKELFCKEKKCIKEAIQEIFKSKIPAHSILFQKLDNDTDFTIRYQYYADNTIIQYKNILNHPYVLVKHQDYTEVFSGAISFEEDSLLFSAQRCFDFAEQILMAEDMNFGHIYKQWNYIPNMNGSSFYDQSKRKNLNIFNEIKGLFFEEPLFTNGKPLVSNINTYHNNLVIDFNALIKNSTENDDSIGVTENKYLEVKHILSDKNEFWFSTKQNLDTFYEDVEQETIQSLKNIFSLRENTITHLENMQEKFSFITVYLKQKEDGDVVKRLIHGLIPEIELLVIETGFIEGDSFVHLEGMVST